VLHLPEDPQRITFKQNYLHSITNMSKATFQKSAVYLTIFIS